jgi:hypothetical protein
MPGRLKITDIVQFIGTNHNNQESTAKPRGDVAPLPAGQEDMAWSSKIIQWLHGHEYIKAQA